MDLSKFKADRTAEDEGVWVALDGDDSGARVKLARIGNRRYREAMQRRMKPFRRALRAGTLEEATAERVTAEVLAETVTSITGDYRLTLPDGVNLAGNLIVRITGTGTEMRAQVVDQAVNINPVSEFVLRKFIEEGTDLDQLVATDVVTLSGKVDTFDLTAGNDLSDMLAKLDQEVGEFVAVSYTHLTLPTTPYV